MQLQSFYSQMIVSGAALLTVEQQWSLLLLERLEVAYKAPQALCLNFTAHAVPPSVVSL